eukprot:TRINITY_DN6069_c0_g1_i1.p1 TRINITY_DN6069_c0_g1~~TRINITY_DN6069_c0_g1_i1.p1  ORF type:complete len:473 (-),score=80.86 TRINITY_DN6069_c0_g1_i1:39-1457(-)
MTDCFPEEDVDSLSFQKHFVAELKQEVRLQSDPATGARAEEDRENEKNRQTILELQDQLRQERLRRQQLEVKIVTLQEKVSRALFEINELLYKETDTNGDAIIEEVMRIIRTLESDLRQLIDPNERLRIQIKNEIISTEKHFVEGVLKIIVEVYHNPLRTSGILSTSDFDDIFSDIHPFYERQAAFLLKCQFLHSNGEEIGQAIIERIAEMHNFSFFFLAKYSSTSKRITELKKTNSRFQKFMSEREYKPESNMLSLQSLLLRPVTHFAYFQMLLERYLNSTSSDDPNFTLLSTIIEQMGLFMVSLEQRQLQTQNRDTLNRLQTSIQDGSFSFFRRARLKSKIYVDFIKPGRHFKKEGDLIKYDSERKKRKYRYVLCNDLMVQARIKKKNKYDVLTVLSLHSAEVQEITVAGENHAFSLACPKPSHTVCILCAPTLEDRKDWMTNIALSIRSLQFRPSASLRLSLTSYPTYH